MSEKSPKAPAKGDDISRNVTVHNLFDGIVLDTGDLDALLEKASEIKVAIQQASIRPNDSVPVKPTLPPTHTESDDDDDDCVDTETGEKC